MIRNALRDNRSVQRFNSLQHTGDNSKFAAESGLPGGDEVIGDSAAVNAGDEATDAGKRGNSPPVGRNGGKQRPDKEAVRERRQFRRLRSVMRTQ